MVVVSPIVAILFTSGWIAATGPKHTQTTLVGTLGGTIQNHATLSQSDFAETESIKETNSSYFHKTTISPDKNWNQIEMSGFHHNPGICSKNQPS